MEGIQDRFVHFFGDLANTFVHRHVEFLQPAMVQNVYKISCTEFIRICNTYVIVHAVFLYIIDPALKYFYANTE